MCDTTRVEQWKLGSMRHSPTDPVGLQVDLFDVMTWAVSVERALAHDSMRGVDSRSVSSLKRINIACLNALRNMGIYRDDNGDWQEE